MPVTYCRADDPTRSGAVVLTDSVVCHLMPQYHYLHDDDWVKKCMEYEVEGPRPRGRPKRTWREVVREDCQAGKLNKKDAMDRCKWRKMIKDVR